MTGPSFLGIGAQGSGTTWLYRSLEKRLDVWVPPVKELHFFDEKIDSTASWIDHMRGDAPIDVRWRRQIAYERSRRVRIKPERIDPARRDWLGTYFFEPPSTEWYRILFESAGPICGEITPDYATLSNGALRSVLEVAPGARAVYLLRNPIEREWSSIMRAVRVGKRSPDVVLRMRRKYVAYAEHIDRWSALVGPGRLYIGFFDDIVLRPEALLVDILEFLGASSNDVALPEGKPNTGNVDDMPAHYAVALADTLGPDIAAFAERLAPAELTNAAAQPENAPARWARTAHWLSDERPTGDIPYPLTYPDAESSPTPHRATDPSATALSSLIL